MTPDQISEGWRLLDAATPGPWDIHPSERTPALTAIAIPGSMHPVAEPADAELIVWARNNLPALLDRLEVALTKLTRVELALDSAHGDMVYVDDIQAAMDGGAL
ncbi:MAG: hypothetical protein A2Y38_25720 [Spirochaetes bacterium GWB1_59_5]|nr:MAG: hypothetical protein A2Y38_25720 [Spirochaetes bacterium GWB1_59_5]